MKIHGANHENLHLVTIAPFFSLPVCTPQTWDPFVPDTEQTQSLPPNAEEGEKAMQFFSLNCKLKNRGRLDGFDINFATVCGRNRRQAQPTLEPALVPGPKKASFPSKAHHISSGGKKIKQ